MAAPSCIFNPISFQTSPQVIVFLLQMVSMALQFSHLSGMFFLLYLHILTPAKELFFQGLVCWICKTRENSNFLKRGKTVISIKIQNFSRSLMTKWTSPLESSREI